MAEKAKDKIFDLEAKYQEYLKKVGQSEEKMGKYQRIEVKRVFYGACGVMMACLRDEIGELPEEEAIDKLQDMWNQVANFWIEQSNQNN